MSNNHRELTGREKQRIKKLITSLCANHDKEAAVCRWTTNVPCLVSAIPTAHCAAISASLSCRKMRSWKLYSPAHQPPTVSNAANRSLLMGNGYTARENVPKKHAASRPQQGCVSTGRKNNRCNRFALEKSCATRLFGGHFSIGKAFILPTHF